MSETKHSLGEGNHPSTPVGLLRRRASEQPEQLAYTFLSDGGAGEESLTYANLDRRARGIGGWLQRQGADGQRVLLLYPPGLDYIAAFFGCLYAGAIAVPAYPPRRGRSIGRLLSIAADSQAAFALTTRAALSTLEPLLAENPSLHRLRWLTLDEEVETYPDRWRDPGATGETLAFLQYSSGSTSTPKGVMVSHGNLLHNQRVIQSAFQQTDSSVIVGWLPLHHDMGLIGNVLQPLYLGARCVLMSPMSFLQSPARWLEAVSRYRATTSGGPNFAYDLCVRKVSAEQRAALDLSSWSVAFNGSEPVRAETLDAFAEAFAPCGFRREAFQPCYGLAEATLMVTGGRQAAPPTIRAVRAKALEFNKVAEADEGDGGDESRLVVGCGHTFFEHEVAVVNPATQTRCDTDEVGEIWFSGPSVAQGYWNRPEETERTFRATFAGAGGRQFLRTGDLGFVKDGELFVTGRLKDLIIILGRNYYPQDIELTVEKCHHSLRPHAAAAFSVEGPGVERLVVVAETASRQPTDSAAVIEAVREAVAREHEVHPYAVVLFRPGALPKTSSGKIQRYACRAMFLEGSPEVVVAEWRAAETSDEALPTDADDLEAWLKAFLSRKLGIAPSQIDSEQPVIRYGLDSLLAVELAHAVERDFGVALDVSQLLQNPSVAEIAAQLREALTGRQGGANAARAVPSPEGARLPLSEGQKAMWLLHQMEPQSAAYNIASAVDINSDLDTPALKRAFEALFARHEALRTTFDICDGEPFQTINEGGQLYFREHDAAAWSERELQDRLTDEARRPFDLKEGPVMRVHLFTRSAREHVLLLSVHHIVADFWSFSVLLRELGVLYEAGSKGAPVSLPPHTARYADHVWREQQLLASPEGERLWDYWQSRLAGELPVLDLPTDRPRPPSQTFNGSSHSFEVGPELTRRLRSLARERGLTLYMVLLAAFEVLLYRYTGQEDLTVGSPTAGRNRAVMSELVGYFVNPVVLRERLSGEITFESLLAQVRQTVVGAFAHQEYPFARLVERLQPARDHSRSPLFQVFFQLNDDRVDGLNMPGLSATLREVESGTAKFDLELNLTSGPQVIKGFFEYNTSLFEASTVQRLSAHFESLLERIADDPARGLSELAAPDTEEEQLLLSVWNETRKDFPLQSCYHELFEAQAARTPDHIAVTCSRRQLTYAELNRRADGLARSLAEAGVGPETVVALLAERGSDFLTAVLAVFKAGGAYLPLDPAHPAKRLAQVLEQSRSAVVLVAEGLEESLRAALEHVAATTPATLVLERALAGAEGGHDRALRPRVAPRNLAYVIYTSGSTGTPKGAMIDHVGMVNHLYAKITDLDMNGSDVVAQNASQCFDISVWQFLAPLLTGGCVHVFDDETARDPARLLAEADARGVTILELVPSMLRATLETLARPDASKPDCRALRWLVVTGEPFAPDLCREWLRLYPSIPAVNAYGPTECSDDVTHYFAASPPLPERGSIPVGRALANMKLYVLDRRLLPLPIGAHGELYVGGSGVGRGYLNEPARTATSFVPDPFSTKPGARMYRTGDLVRYERDGNLNFLGRIDEQVKVRGFRIELGEIEAALHQHPDLREAVVVVREDAAHGKSLVAYVVPRQSSPGAAADWREFLRERLPDYMVPSALVRLEQLPLTTSGKIDRRALPPPDGDDSATAVYTAPRDAVEQELANIWADLLRVSRVGVYDDFFDLGGHSLLATQLVSRLRDAFQADIPLRVVFEKPILAELAQVVTQARAARESRARPRIQARPRGSKSFDQLKSKIEQLSDR